MKLKRVIELSELDKGWLVVESWVRPDTRHSITSTKKMLVFEKTVEVSTYVVSKLKELPIEFNPPK